MTRHPQAALAAALVALLGSGCFDNGTWELLSWQEPASLYDDFPEPGHHGRHNVTGWHSPPMKAASNSERGVHTTLRVYQTGQTSLDVRGPKRIGQQAMEERAASIFEELGLPGPHITQPSYRHDKIPD